MSRRARRLRRHHEQPEINITAFLNLMVVLIPFLLLTAAFNQLTILDLYLPTQGSPQQEEDKLQQQRPELEVILRRDTLTINDNKSGPIAVLPLTEQGQYDLPVMQDKLKEIKANFTDMTQISLLSEPDIIYDRIVQVMDALRTAKAEQAGSSYRIELFPDIALGGAPALAGSTKPPAAKK